MRLFEYPTIGTLTAFLAAREQSPLNSIHQRATRQREAFARRQRQAVAV